MISWLIVDYFSVLAILEHHGAKCTIVWNLTKKKFVISSFLHCICDRRYCVKTESHIASHFYWSIGFPWTNAGWCGNQVTQNNRTRGISRQKNDNIGWFHEIHITQRWITTYMYENLHIIHINDELRMEYGENYDIIRTT